MEGNVKIICTFVVNVYFIHLIRKMYKETSDDLHRPANTYITYDKSVVMICHAIFFVYVI